MMLRGRGLSEVILIRPRWRGVMWPVLYSRQWWRVMWPCWGASGLWDWHTCSGWWQEQQRPDLSGQQQACQYCFAVQPGWLLHKCQARDAEGLLQGCWSRPCMFWCRSGDGLPLSPWGHPGTSCSSSCWCWFILSFCCCCWLILCHCRHRYAQGQGWKASMISCTEADAGGYKEVVLQVGHQADW